MNHEHYNIVCGECGTMMEQCKCMGPKKTKKSLCNKCKQMKLAYFQGTEDPKTKYEPDKPAVKRENLDVRHPHVYTWYLNHDYTDAGPDETGIGGGLYHGPMDKFKSVKDFLDQRRSQMKKREEEGKKKSNAEDRLVQLLALAKEVENR